MPLKKLLIILLPLFLAGCSAPPVTEITEKNAPDSLASYNSADAEARINQIRNGLTPMIKPIKNNQSGAQGQDQDNAEDAADNQEKFQLEDLASQFSQAAIKTNFGDITVKFNAKESPLTVNVFMNLAKKGLYDGTRFHRVIKDFMIQGGDPLSKDSDPSNDGKGGPGFQFKDEINSHKLVKGSLAMANSGPNTNGSQFFIVTAEATSWLDGKHTNFGYVTEGLEIVEKIGNLETDKTDHPVKEVMVQSIELKK